MTQLRLDLSVVPWEYSDEIIVEAQQAYGEDDEVMKLQLNPSTKS